MIRHVYPINDLKEHETEGFLCHCGPKILAVGGGWLVIHHSYDGRETNFESASMQ